MNYGGKWDIVNAINSMLNDIDFASKNKKISEVDFEKYLSLQGDSPDLLIRTAGEQRLSNFMLWQHAYSELYFTDCLWPDFNEKELDAAIGHYQKRQLIKEVTKYFTLIKMKQLKCLLN